jgi:hypothetical protein
MTFPQTLIQGDSASWTDEPWVQGARTLDSSVYAQSYVLRGPVGLTLASATDGPGWVTTLTPAQAASLAPGVYWWVALLVGATERITIASGEVTVSADLTQQSGIYDGRTLAEKALSDCETALATFRSTRGRTKKYTIGSRSMEFDTAADILIEISYWKTRVLNDRTAKDIANGLGNPRKLYVRFR